MQTTIATTTTRRKKEKNIWIEIMRNFCRRLSISKLMSKLQEFHLKTHTNTHIHAYIHVNACAQAAFLFVLLHVCVCVCGSVHVRPFATLLMLKADLYVNNNFQLGLKSNKRSLPDEKWKCSQLFCWFFSGFLLKKMKQIEQHKLKEMCSVPRNNINIRLPMRLLCSIFVGVCVLGWCLNVGRNFYSENNQM